MNWPSGTCVASGAIRTRRSSRWARRWQPSTSRHCQPCRAPASRLWQRATGWTVAATSSPSVARQAIACNRQEGAIAERGQFRHPQDAHSVRYRPCPDRGRPPRLLCQNQRSGAAAPGGATRPRSGSSLGEARHVRPDVGGRSFPRKARFSASTSTRSPTPTRIRPKPASFSN